MTSDRPLPGHPDLEADRRWMRLALELALHGWGHVHPNPMVGAVVVADGEVVGTGFHAEFGGPHAEVRALNQAGERARGASLYLTLEPCAHHGKTPPCTEAILAAGVERVIIAARDPNPTARGGVEWLRARGVEVATGIEVEASRSQNAAFFHYIECGTPYLALKFGLTLDGRLSHAPDRPTQITGPDAQAEVHRLRAGYDAIMIGSGTVMADNPLLTVRGDLIPRTPPTRVILDSDVALPESARLIATIAEAPLLLIAAEDAPDSRIRALRDAGAMVTTVPRGNAGLDLLAVTRELAALGMRSVFCEGGGRLGASLIRAGLVQRLYLFVAPRIFGEHAVPAFPGSFDDSGEDWRRSSLQTFGEDFLVTLDRNG